MVKLWTKRFPSSFSRVWSCFAGFAFQNLIREFGATDVVRSSSRYSHAHVDAARRCSIVFALKPRGHGGRVVFVCCCGWLFVCLVSAVIGFTGSLVGAALLFLAMAMVGVATQAIIQFLLVSVQAGI